MLEATVPSSSPTRWTERSSIHLPPRTASGCPRKRCQQTQLSRVPYVPRVPRKTWSRAALSPVVSVPGATNLASRHLLSHLYLTLTHLLLPRVLLSLPRHPSKRGIISTLPKANEMALCLASTCIAAGHIFSSSYSSSALPQALEKDDGFKFLPCGGGQRLWQFHICIYNFFFVLFLLLFYSYFIYYLSQVRGNNSFTYYVV